MDIMYTHKIDHLPFGTLAAAVASWLEHIGWKGKPLRAVGPRAWIVGSPTLPPPGQHAFNSMPVLIRALTQTNTTAHPIIAGPKTYRKPAPATASTDVPPDPWAAWTGPRITPSVQPPQPAARALEGPIESKFQAQETRLDQMEKAIATLKDAQQQQSTAIAEAQADAQKRDDKQKQYFEQRFTEFRKELHQGVTTALQTQSQHFDTSLSEIKRLLLENAKRKNPEQGDADMTSS